MNKYILEGLSNQSKVRWTQDGSFRSSKSLTLLLLQAFCFPYRNNRCTFYELYFPGGHLLLVLGRLVRGVSLCHLLHHGLQVHPLEEEVRDGQALPREPDPAEAAPLHLQARHV